MKTLALLHFHLAHYVSVFNRNQSNIEQTGEEIEHEHSVGVCVGCGGSLMAVVGGIVTKEETAWESITDGIDGTNKYIEVSSQVGF